MIPNVSYVLTHAEYDKGKWGRVSEVVNGRRAISKVQAKSPGEFFKVSPDLFI